MLIKLNFIYLVPNDQNVSEVILLQFFKILNASKLKVHIKIISSFWLFLNMSILNLIWAYKIMPILTKLKWLDNDTSKTLNAIFIMCQFAV